MNGGFISDELLHYKPTGTNDCARLQDLMAKNPDVVGWVTIDGTNIDYPFVQGKDNQEYLNKNVLGSPRFGSGVLDTRNSRAMTDPTICSMRTTWITVRCLAMSIGF